MSLTPAFLDELRARTHLSALVGRTVKLTRAGREMKGCCPFHNEKTPSFYVNDEKGFYHCFGCSAHGDAIRWMTDQQGLPFMDAVKELAAAAGMEVPAPDRQSAERAERAKSLHDVMQAAADWFTQQLGSIDGAEARALLERRGVSTATQRAFGFGYAPDSRTRLRAALKEYGDAILVEAGLLIEVEGKEPYDRFRGRLIIPIRDARGRVIAFGGRIIGDGEPKYLNSPDTPLFDKGRTLYNFDRAGAAARKADRVFVVEGYMDAVALAQAGVAEVVAPLGTALTEAQLERLWRMTDVPVLCLDGDAAGQKAAIRAAHRALPLLAPGRSLSFVTLPDGQDPDDLVRARGAAAFEALVREAEPLEERLWKAELATVDASSVAGRTKLLDNLKQLSARVLDRDYASSLRATLTKRYFDLFGLKKQLTPEQASKINEVVAAANRHPRRDHGYMLRRAILLGLMRHPAMIPITREDFARLPLEDRYLDDWRRELFNVARENDVLTESIVDAVLATTKVSPIERRSYERDLAFSFYRRSSPEEKAREDLRRVIEIMVDEHETSIALRLAEQAFQRDFTEQSFLEQTSRQREAIECRQKLSEWLEQADALDAA